MVNCLKKRRDGGGKDPGDTLSSISFVSLAPISNGCSPSCFLYSRRRYPGDTANGRLEAVNAVPTVETSAASIPRGRYMLYQPEIHFLPLLLCAVTVVLGMSMLLAQGSLQFHAIMTCALRFLLDS